MFKKIRHLWHVLRRLSGDDAYEQYLKHHKAFHATTVDAPPALSRKEFFKYWQESKWKGVNRCC
ncbi:MAG: YbdD/YjiX family protein [Methylophilaceae bacterium]